MVAERRKERELRKSVEESGRFTQVFAIGALVVLAILDQAVEAQINVDKFIYYSLLALAVGASKSVKKAIDRFFNNDGGGK